MILYLVDGAFGSFHLYLPFMHICLVRQRYLDAIKRLLLQLAIFLMLDSAEGHCEVRIVPLRCAFGT